MRYGSEARTAVKPLPEWWAREHSKPHQVPPFGAGEASAMAPRRKPQPSGAAGPSGSAAAAAAAAAEEAAEAYKQFRKKG